MGSGLTPAVVLFHMGQGMRQVEIAEAYGVSRQYINNLAKKGGYLSPITTVTENMPWEVASESYRHPAYMAMRLVGHFAVAQSNLEAESIERALGFIKRLRTYDAVVDYNPSYSGIIGVTTFPGFSFLPRVEADEDFIMKIRPGVRITPLGDKIWRMPDPQVYEAALAKLS